MAVSRFASALSMATASGMSMEESIELAARLCGGAKEIDEKTAKCREAVLDGVSAADALSDCGLFSNRDCRLMKLAEQTGSLHEALEDIAARQEEESLRRIDRLVSSIEPAIIVITSVLAGVILISVMLPLIDETARKVHELHPLDAQTGPAVRYDENVISMQQRLLDDDEMRRVYELLSKSIYHQTQ
jgi:type IV pilus assembly protein PilC